MNPEQVIMCAKISNIKADIYRIASKYKVTTDELIKVQSELNRLKELI